MISSIEGSRLLGYARVSTEDQDPSLQIDALEKPGIAKSFIFMDKLSGARIAYRPLRTGDLPVLSCSPANWGRQPKPNSPPRELPPGAAGIPWKPPLPEAIMVGVNVPVSA